MSILVNKDTRVLVQGITGQWGAYYAQELLGYGTKIVAGVTPLKGGEKLHGIPIYNTVEEARREQGANAAILFVPPAYTKDAFYEAIAAEMEVIVAVVEHVPVQDMMLVKQRLKGGRSVFIGPNSPGIATPGEIILGFMPAHACMPGRVGLISRSGTLMYQVTSLLCQEGIGQSTALGIGGDPIVGISMVEVLALFNEDPGTDLVVILGEVGGSQEERAAEYLASQFKKPVVAFVGGRLAPEGKTMGHAGAIVVGGKGTHASKVSALKKAGAIVAPTIIDIAPLVRKALKKA